MHDCLIIGGGIVGLATAHSLLERQPGLRLILLEKESELAQHQTGRNSGVIHSGIYYKPGSFKAKFARAGSRSMVEFCRAQGIRHDVCGKVIVATREAELPQLEKLFQRGLENELPVRRLTADEVRETEPHVRCLAGLKVPTTGIVDYRAVCAKLAALVRARGGQIELGTRVARVTSSAPSHRIQTSRGDFEARFLINCAGLHSDRVARLARVRTQARIVPFRGEYYELVPERRHLVKTLIYPVPNPAFPFLGVHFTRMIDGSVHAGPNAVLAFKREGYHKTDVSLRDSWETLTYGGFWKLARKNWDEGWMEMRRSFSKAQFVRSLQQLIPEVREADVVPTHAGVRAQALQPDGGLVDDFLFVEERNAIHVCNAPSPAATASLEIGRTIAAKLPSLRTRTTVPV
ncbi:MAG TPA: L-2-hydroxyglutarate oxidase [Verrucomicrobiae bacterium]|nr:L-2-hydroxyglutarate oxidase [Verrucomicrobiae bacterium]